MRLRAKLKNMADGEEELLEAVEVDQKLSESQKFALYQQKGKLLFLHTEKLFVRYTSPTSSKVKNAPLLSPRDPLSHVNFSTSFSRPFLAFTKQKAQKESGKCSLPAKKKFSSRHLCLQPTNHTPRIPQICNNIFCCETSWSRTR